MLAAVFLVVFGLVIDLGGIPGVRPTYFCFWRDPGPFVEHLAPGSGSDDGSGSGTAAQSPFVIAVAAAGHPAVPSAINAVVITSAWSSSNQALLSGTRVLYGLALKRQAARWRRFTG